MHQIEAYICMYVWHLEIAFQLFFLESEKQTFFGIAGNFRKSLRSMRESEVSQCECV